MWRGLRIRLLQGGIGAQKLRDEINALCARSAELRKAGLPDQALEAVWQAKRLCAGLPSRMTARDLRCLSRTTSWLSAELYRCGDPASGIEVTRDLVRAARAAAHVEEPTRSECLGVGLYWLSCWFDGTEEGKDELATVRETVRLRRIVYDESPEAFAPQLARALNRFARLLGERGRYPEACAVQCEATGLLCEVVGTESLTYLDSLTRYVSRLDRFRKAVDDQDKRIEAARMLVRASRVLASCDTGRYEEWLARALTVLLSALDAPERNAGTPRSCPETVEVAGEIVQLRRRLLARGTTPDANRRLAFALHEFSKFADREGDWGEAVAASREAIVLFRGLLAQDVAEAADAADTAGAAGAAGGSEGEGAGERDREAERSRDSDRVRAAEHNQEIDRGKLAELLTRLALVLLRTNRTEESRAACDEARTLLLSADVPDFTQLGRLSGVNALLLARCGRRAGAIAACREQIDFLTTAEAGVPTRYVVTYLYSSWRVLSELLEKDGQERESEHAAEQARELKRRLNPGA